MMQAEWFNARCCDLALRQAAELGLDHQASQASTRLQTRKNVVIQELQILSDRGFDSVEQAQGKLHFKPNCHRQK